MNKSVIRIAGASGFWGDASRATPSLLQEEQLDFIVYDYLAEITMSILARARSKDSSLGYATDFISGAMQPNLLKIATKGVKIITNAGGVNPQACAQKLTELIVEQNLSLKVACVFGDDLLDQASHLADHNYIEMFNGESFPPIEEIKSINAYLGAFPVAQALSQGADIVITGRCVDSAVTLGACIYHFGWCANDLDFLAGGSLAGHILECGTQVTGGNFTDWQQSGNLDDIGYPIAEITSEGHFICTKTVNSSGVVSIGTVAEQMVYEIGDPQSYLLPDVRCDFSQVKLQQLEQNKVHVSGAIGRGVPDTYKVCATWADGFRGGVLLTYYGEQAQQKAKAMAEAAIAASHRQFRQFNLAGFTETSIEVLGGEYHYGPFAHIQQPREVILKIAAKHSKALGIGIMLKEISGLGLSTPPGLCGFQGGRPKPSPVVRLFSFLLPKQYIDIGITINGIKQEVQSPTIPEQMHRKQPEVLELPLPMECKEQWVEIPLIQLAWGRSGDKGNKANIGIIARDGRYLPYIAQTLTCGLVSERFSHFLDKDTGTVERFYLPGCHALNFLLHDALGGGGVASIRSDPQGKGYAQLLLSVPIAVPESIAQEVR